MKNWSIDLAGEKSRNKCGSNGRREDFFCRSPLSISRELIDVAIGRAGSEASSFSIGSKKYTVQRQGR